MSQVKMYPDNDPNVPTDYKAVPESRHCDTCICPMPQNPDIMDPNIIRDLQSHIPSFELAASHLRAEAPYRVRSPSDLMDPPSRTGTLYFTAPSTPADEVFTGPLLHPISSSAATLPLPGNAPYDRTCSPNTSSHHPYASRPHHNLNPYAASSSTVVATSDLLHPHASHNRHASSSTTLAPASSTNMFAGAHNFHIQSQSNTVCTGNYTTIIQSPLCGNCGAIR
ncbi:hypothetical protein DFP72DRAFT_154396 [Ephemerocybe angulata]|uniref:Uncharacterized protein n=1 Tax=Ephemerocybe angulata TaxID=980116 RepID=A0A8H6H9I9_9AGAR|nr:hypothetical protein DFP72DRAFT_154396 [Tulosesus angulatus]